MKSRTDLTSSARLHAERKGVAQVLAALELGAWVNIDDVIELPDVSGQDAFIVRSRRVVVASDGAHTLVFQLDHPPRS